MTIRLTKPITPNDFKRFEIIEMLSMRQNPDYSTPKKEWVYQVFIPTPYGWFVEGWFGFNGSKQPTKATMLKCKEKMIPFTNPAYKTEINDYHHYSPEIYSNTHGKFATSLIHRRKYSNNDGINKINFGINDYLNSSNPFTKWVIGEINTETLSGRNTQLKRKSKPSIRQLENAVRHMV